MNRVDHGATISGEEYDSAMIELHSNNVFQVYSKELDEFLQRAELNITIDHRLGVFFPYDRRNELWEAQQNIQKRKFKLAFFIFLRLIGFDRLSKIVWEEFSNVLSSDEMLDFFGEEFYDEEAYLRD